MPIVVTCCMRHEPSGLGKTQMDESQCQSHITRAAAIRQPRVLYQLAVLTACTTWQHVVSKLS